MGHVIEFVGSRMVMNQHLLYLTVLRYPLSW